MKRIGILAMAVFFMVSSCETTTEPELLSESTKSNELIYDEPQLQLSTGLPPISMSAMIVIELEFLNKDDGSGHTSEGLSRVEYIEKRLIELYPDLIHPGMIVQLHHEFQEHVKEYRSYQLTIGEDLEEEDLLEYCKLEEFIEKTQMTEAEISDLLSYQSLAKKGESATLHEIQSLVSKNGRAEGSLLDAVGLVGIYVSPLIINQAEDRSEARAIQYYGTDQRGTRGDAFKHIFGSVYLRRFIGKPAAQAILTARETIVEPNPYKGDTEMDLHNNKIGYDTKYSQFRGSLVFGWGWERWAENVRDWMNAACTRGIPMHQVSNWNGSSVPNSRPAASADIGDETLNAQRFVYYSDVQNGTMVSCWVSPCWGVQCSFGYTCNSMGDCVRDNSVQGCPVAPCPSGASCIGGQCVFF